MKHTWIGTSFLPVLALMLVSASSFSQYTKTDSAFFHLGSRLERRPSCFYIKGVVGGLRSQTELTGDPIFSAYKRVNVLKGVRIGFHHYSGLSLESGLTTFPIEVGYTLTEYPPTAGSATSRVGNQLTYKHLPIVVGYSIWMPNKRLAVRILAGVGFNFGNVGISFQETATPGNRSAYKTKLSHHEMLYRKRFTSWEVGGEVTYELHRRFNVNLRGRCLFFKRDVFQFNADLEQDVPRFLASVHASSGPIGVGIEGGLSYQFGFSKRYRLPKS